jgi:acetylornithine deacetylase/succinyl-diaminopimelate desuccinylase family protein
MAATVQQEPAGRIIGLLRDLIAIPTAYPPGTSTEMARSIATTLAAVGYDVQILTCKEGLDNVVARLGKGKPSLVFNSHIDTVGPGNLALWSHPPFESHVESGVVFGLGAANCKGSAAVQIWLAEEIARRGGPARGEVVFTFVTDEESLDRNGMAFLRESGAIEPDMLLLGAPTDNVLIVAERGVLWVEINSFGRPAHAGDPEAGDNAIARMMRICTALDAEMGRRLATRIAGDMRSTMNIGRIDGGVNTNVVPSRCRVEIDRRLLPGETVDEAFAEFAEIVAGVGEPVDMVTIEKLRGTNGFIGGGDGALVLALTAAIRARTGADATYTSAIGVSDGRYFADDGIEIVNFGPGVGSEGHASNESVEIAKLVDGAAILREMVAETLGFADVR